MAEKTEVTELDLQKTVLGLELGSTRIKAVLIDEKHVSVASGDWEWENRLVDGIWTYSLEDVRIGVQNCFAALRRDVKKKYDLELTTVGAIGISAMMHGYLPFDSEGNQLSAFRTWRNTITGEAAEKLTALFDFNIPQRWSIAHLYQAILNGEEHVGRISYLTTLAGYLHFLLTGEKLMGVGEASGMFPIDSEKCDYDETMLEKFRDLTGIELRKILPQVVPAGVRAGTLTESGARFLRALRGRRGHRHGRDEFRPRPHRQCLGRYERFCDDRHGKAAGRTPRDRHGHDA